MASYSFKSSGTTQQQQKARQLAVTPVPIGILTPLRPGTSEGIWGMTISLEDQIADNLRNLIMTNWGERLGLYDFGANLKEITTDIVSQNDFDSQAVERIRNAVTKWMPFINLETFESKILHTDNLSTGIIKLYVTYSVPALGVTKMKTLEVTLYVI